MALEFKTAGEGQWENWELTIRLHRAAHTGQIYWTFDLFDGEVYAFHYQECLSLRHVLNYIQEHDSVASAQWLSDCVIKVSDCFKNAFFDVGY